MSRVSHWLGSLLLCLPLHAGTPACIPLEADAITAADLSGPVPAFAKLPAETRVAWAPAPGLTRWISSGEMARLGHQHGLAVASEGICLLRVVVPIDREKLLLALHAAQPGSAIELIAFGPQDAPPGRLEFLARALPRLPRQPAVPIVAWRGRVVTAEGRAYPVWARVRVSIGRQAVVARRALAAGDLIDVDTLESVALTDYPGWDAPIAEAAIAIGRKARRAIPPREPLMTPLLTVRRDVERGDPVEVELPGAATLTAQAESPGRAGETILLKNPLTGKRFSSTVTGIGKATVQKHGEGTHAQP